MIYRVTKHTRAVDPDRLIKGQTLMKSSLKVVGLILGLIAVAGTTSCGSESGSQTADGGSESGSQTADDGKVTVWTFMNPGDANDSRNRTFKDIIDRYEADNPGIDIVVEPQPWDQLESKFLTACSLGNAPDLIMLLNDNLTADYETGCLADLNESLSPEFVDTAFSDFIPAALEAGRVEGGAQGALVMWPNPGTVMFYREDLVKSAGLEAFPASWDEFLALAASAEGEWDYPASVSLAIPTKSIFFTMMASFPSQPLDPETWEFDLLGPEAIEVVNKFRELERVGGIPESSVSATDTDAQDEFATGARGSLWNYAPKFTTFKGQASGYDGDSLSMALTPGLGGGDPASVTQYWMFGLSKHSESSTEAADFLEELFSTESALAWAMIGGQVPARQSVLEDPWFSTPEADDIALLTELSSDPGVLTVPGGLKSRESIFEVLNNVLGYAITTDRPAEDILADAKSELGW
jgi:multiple sugar transport system substrate-binding protein